MRRTRAGWRAERGAKAFAREVIDRAAEVHVHEIRTARFDERRGPRHLVRVVAGELHAEEGLVGAPAGSARTRLAGVCFSRRATVISLIVTRAPSSDA